MTDFDCATCHGTGSLFPHMLDCPLCSAAEIRARLNDMMLSGPYQFCPYEYTEQVQDAVWEAYKLGAAREIERINQQEKVA